MARATEILVLFLSVWRISKIVTEEEGPGMIFTKLREISGAEHNGFSDWNDLTWHSKLMQCPYCLSVWVSLFLYLIYLINKNLFWGISMSFSGSAITVLIEDYNNGNRNG